MFSKTLTAALFFFAASTTAFAAPVTIDGILFPDGEASFADAVVDFTPGDPAATAANALNPASTLGVPDFGGTSTPTFLSLGNGGSLTLQFVDNALTGSGSADPDLFVFEIGPIVEATDVEISNNGVDFFSVGQVSGSTSLIDIDAFGFGVSDLFSFVRLTDVAGQNGTFGTTVGADIDAVGAISSTTPPIAAVPLPAAAPLLAGGLGLLGIIGWRRRRVT